MASIRNNSFEYKVLEKVYSLVLVLDKKGMIHFINEPASEILEIPSDVEPGKVHFTTNIDEEENDLFCEYILNAIYKKNVEHKGTINFVSPSKKKYVFRISTSYLEEHDFMVITLDDLTVETNLLDRIRISSFIFSALLFAIGTWVLFCEWWYMMKQPIHPRVLTVIAEFLSAVLFVVIFKSTNLSLKDLGIISNNVRKDINIGLVVSAICVVLIFGLKIVGRMINPDLFHPERPFFYFDSFLAVTYFFTAGVQEFLARCVAQFNIERILTGRFKVIGAIILSGLLFAVIHIYYGFVFMLCAALLSIFEGFIYAKNKSLISLWIIHYVYGLVGMSLGIV